MKVYIAARYDRREELKAVDQMLRDNGHEPTSNWVLKGDLGGPKASAQKDAEDVMRADAVLFFAEPKGSENRGGGRYFELGLAWSLGKRTLVVLKDDHETVFTHLDEMEIYDSVDGAIRGLGNE